MTKSNVWIFLPSFAKRTYGFIEKGIYIIRRNYYTNVLVRYFVANPSLLKNINGNLFTIV
jgi:hypothetical protein